MRKWMLIAASGLVVLSIAFYTANGHKVAFS